MKKVILLLFTIVFIIGCTKEDDLELSNNVKLVDFVFRSTDTSSTNKFKIDISYEYSGTEYDIVDGAYINMSRGVYQIYRKVPVGSKVKYNFSEFVSGVTIEVYIERYPIIPPTYRNQTSNNLNGTFVVQ